MTEHTIGFGEAVPVAENTVLVGGRPMNLGAMQADVAAVLLHRSGGTLYMVDTGATPEFRALLHTAIEGLRPFDRVVLVNSHGHPDHVGNNGIIDELGAGESRHYVGRADLGMMADSAGYFSRGFGAAAERLPLPFPADQMAEGMIAMFGELDTRLARITTLETLPLELLETGAGAWPGWRFGDDLYVLKASGHTAGEMVVYLPKVKVLFTGDEAMGFYPVWPDADELKSFTVLTRARRLVEEGAVDAFANGHQFQVRDGGEAASVLDALIGSYRDFDRAVHEALAVAGGATVFAIRDAAASVSAQHGLHGESENKLFAGMQVLKKLEELGAVASGTDPRSTVFSLPAG